MDEVRQIVNSYKILKEKSLYLKNYLEHIDAIYKKSSDLLFRAAQIPRDTSWNDTNLINLLEMGEKQRVVFDEMSSLHNLTIAKDIEELLVHINTETTHIENDLGDIIKLNNNRLGEIEQIKHQHKATWINKQDPWITDVRLKLAIKKMYQAKEENDLKIQSRIQMFEDKLKCTTEIYLNLLRNFVKLQKSVYVNLIETVNIEIKNNDKQERYFDAISDESKEKQDAKLITAYNNIIESISNELSKESVTVYKNIEPVKYSIVKYKRGFTNDWQLMFVAVTKARHLHLFDLQSKNYNVKKYTQLIAKLNRTLKCGIVSIFDFKKSPITFADEQNLIGLSEEIKDSVDKIINSVYLSLDLRDKIIKIEKDKLIITIDDKHQNGLSSLFGINVIRIRPFTLTSCYELYFSMLKNNETIVEQPCETKNQPTDEDCQEIKVTKTKNIIVNEDNPWID